jgi:putative transposase
VPSSPLEYLHQSPRKYNVQSATWTLRLCRKHIPTLSSLSDDSSACCRFRRWKIKRKVGRMHIQSPDPLYDKKRKVILSAYERAKRKPDTFRLLYADEFTYYRQPVLGSRYYARGKKQPTASWKGGDPRTKRRVAGALDAQSGRVIHAQASKMGVDGLVQFLAKIRKTYGPDQRIVLVWDNWPVHKHHTIVKEAIKQRIRLLYLPTYAPWTNPIEKLWKWLKDTCLRFHDRTNTEQWKMLWTEVEAFLNRFQPSSDSLLAYCGLSFPD